MTYSLFFDATNHETKNVITSVRNLEKSPHWKKVGDNRWLDTSRNREFALHSQNDSEKKLRIAEALLCASFEQVGYKKIPNTI